MHGLAPAAPVARLREPAAPELDRVLEVQPRLLCSDGLGLVAVGQRLEDERLALAGRERELADDAVFAGTKVDLRGERKRQRGGPEDDAVLVNGGLVLLAAVVEARLDLDPEAHLAADAEYAADQAADAARPA